MTKQPKTDLLSGSRIYLSGPMDFVACRHTEKTLGWRNRVGEFLKKFNVTVFDPWNKPSPRGLKGYGVEDVNSGDKIKSTWSYKNNKKGAKARAWCAEAFWETVHIDLRMVDTSDITIAYVPTNIYSVGTPHEIIMATQQHKPVLFVSPPVVFPALHQLREHLKGDEKGLELLGKLGRQVPIKENIRGVPSLWYMPIVGSEGFFDGFGFAKYRKQFGWVDDIQLDEHEKMFPPQRPLLPFLEKLNKKLPKKWDAKKGQFVQDDDWLLWDIKNPTK